MPYDDLKPFHEFLPQAFQIPPLKDKDVERIRGLSCASEKLLAIFQSVYDPEMPISLWDLGLIYRWSLDIPICRVEMTLTSPACPVAQSLPQFLKLCIAEYIPECSDISIHLVWTPPWGPDRLTERGQLLFQSL